MGWQGERRLSRGHRRDGALLLGEAGDAAGLQDQGRQVAGVHLGPGREGDPAHLLRDPRTLEAAVRVGHEHAALEPEVDVRSLREHPREVGGAPPVGDVEPDEVPAGPDPLGRFRGEVRVPDQLGRWALVLDVEDAIVGSYATLGSEPAVMVFEVVPPRGIEPID